MRTGTVTVVFARL